LFPWIPVSPEGVAIVGRPKSDNVAVVAVDFWSRVFSFVIWNSIIMGQSAQRDQSFALGQPLITLGECKCKECVRCRHFPYDEAVHESNVPNSWHMAQLREPCR